MDNHHPISDDPFLSGFGDSDLRIASEFLTRWLPFLTRDMCYECAESLDLRVRSIDPDSHVPEPPVAEEISNPSDNTNELNNCDTTSLGSWKDEADTNSLGSWKDESNGWSDEPVVATTSTSNQHGGGGGSGRVKAPVRISWADMAQEEDELEGEYEVDEDRVAEKKLILGNAQSGESSSEAIVTPKPSLSREQREYIRFTNVQRKKDFICLERVNGHFINILDGLELHTGVFSAAEQKRITDFIYQLQEMGKKGQLKERTYTAPQKWMRGKGRVTIQFGCCYNYAVDKQGNLPGILQSELVDPIPPLFKVMIRRLVRWHVLPPSCVPDSCIVNIYDEGDCIPPHIDNHDFVRPFSTISLLTESDIVFGSNLKITGDGEFSGAYAIPLPVGSVLVINGNGADVAKHCVPAVHAKRISITFRRMDERKRPMEYTPEPDLLNLQPLDYDTKRPNTNTLNQSTPPRQMNRQVFRRSGDTRNLEIRSLSSGERQVVFRRSDDARGSSGERGGTRSEPRYPNQRWQGHPADRRRLRVSLGSGL